MSSNSRRNSKETLKHLAQYFEECTGLTAVHGVQYIGDRKRTWFERLIWAVIVTTSVSVCTKFVLQTYHKWQNAPVYVTIGTALVPIHDIAFPAITICPETKSNSSVYYYPDWIGRAFDKDVEISRVDRLKFEYISMICNRTYASSNFTQQKFDADIHNFLYNITPRFEDTFTNCQFANLVENCSEIFTPIFTREGVCYTFNALDRSKLFQKDVYQFSDFHQLRKKMISPYPRRAVSSGVTGGLQVELRAFVKDMDYRCATALQGFKIIVHDSSELPTQTHNYLRVPLNQAVFAALSPEVISTKKNLESYSADLRQCYFDEEKDLSHFRYYSRSNCEVECLGYLMENILGCLDFYLPRANISTPICGATQLEHIRMIERILATYISNTTSLNSRLEELLLKLIFDVAQSEELVEKSATICNCLPSCSSVEYSFETTQSDYYWYYFEGHKEYKDREYRSLINIHFKDAYYIPMQREEMFGSMDFIAYTGGLLGLFIGFSFISLAEIIYFLTLRIVCNAKLFGRKMWYGNPNC